MSRVSALGAALLLAACSRESSNPVPPRVTTPAVIPAHSSTIAAPISATVEDLAALLNAEVPMRLARINERKRSCIKLPVVGRVPCRLEGEVTRGTISVTGDGDVLKVRLPVDGRVSAKDIGNVIKSETATATAEATARVRLRGIGNWVPRASVDLDYRWIEKPGVDVLGQRLTFAGKADPEMAKLIARLEADVPKHIARLHPREKLEEAWAEGFTSLKLNDHNPPVWMRVTPKSLHYKRYYVDHGVVTLLLGVTVIAETFVGDRPPDPVVTALPPPAVLKAPPGGVESARGFHFQIPVIADYAQIEPVLERALNKLEKRPIELPAIGAVTAKFDKVTMFPTTGGRLAIGLKMRVDTPGQWLDPRGTVWLTGRPVNAPGSQLVEVRDLAIAGRPDSASFRVLLAVAESAAVSGALSEALSQNFTKDYNKIVAKASKAIADKRLGAFILSATITDVKNGVIYPAGQGLYMPVDARGTASLRYEPLKTPR